MLRVVTMEVMPPLVFRDVDGMPRGLVPDLWSAFARETGVVIDLQVLPWAQALARMRAGEADVIDTITPTEERRQWLAFSPAQTAFSVSLFFHESIRGFRDAGSARGFRVGLQEGDACGSHLRAAGVTNLAAYRNYETMVEAARQGEILVFCGHEQVIHYLLGRLGGGATFRHTEPLYLATGHWAVRRDEEATLALVTEGMARIQPGERHALERRWMGDGGLPPPPSTLPPYALPVFAVLLASLLALLVLQGLLRRFVRERTRELEETQAALRERVKEQTCLYAVFRESEDLTKPLGQLLEDVARCMPAGWFYPDSAIARIEVDGVAFETGRLAGTTARMSAPILVDDQRRGQVTLAYRDPLPQRDEGPFLREERLLLDAIAARLGSKLDRRSSDRLLRDSESKFRTLFEETRQAAFLVEEGRIVAVNKAVLAMLRARSADEVLGRFPTAFTPAFQPDGRRTSDLEAEVNAAVLAHGSYEFEAAHRRIDGEPFIARVMLTRMQQEGRPLLHAVWTDITALRQAEQELTIYRQRLELLVEERTRELDAATASLRASNDEQRAIFDAAPYGIILVRERMIIRCNRAAEQMFGYEPGGMLGCSTRIWYADDADFAAAGQAVGAEVRDHGIYMGEHELLRRDGSRLWVRSTARAIDPQDLTKGLAGVFIDITTERLAADRLRLAAEEQEAIFNTATSGIALLKDGVLIRCNRRLHELFGVAEGRMVGQSATSWFLDQQALPAEMPCLMQTLTEGRLCSIERELRRADGSVFWGRLNGMAVDPADRAKGSVWVIDDISAEHDLLEETSKARAAAEEAARAKSDFLANMSHEIRTPMNAIIGLTHLLLRTELSARRRDLLGKVQAAGQHLLGVINDILDFSKIEAGKLTIEETDFNLERLLAQTTTLLTEKASAKGLEIILEIGPDVPTDLRGDPLRIGQILLNFASNAVKFTERGGVTITVERAGSDGPAALLRFIVRDTGIGVEDAQKGRLFQSFQQADMSTSRKHGGTGLGLVISKRLAEAMGGSVGFESKAGEGSAFWFTLPLRLAAPSRAALVPRADLHGVRVLVVDDNAQARASQRAMLAALTFSVATAASGAEAIEAVRAADAEDRPYAIVFLDWRMAGMDGRQAAARIRALPLRHPPHLVLVGAHGREESQPQAEDLASARVLTKPLTPSLLLDTAMALLATPGGAPAPPRAPAATGASLVGRRVLVAEDNAANQEVARALLESLGLVVDVAGDGAAALQMAIAAPYDLVLMDVQMPVLDGLAATRAIRRIPHLASLPIIAMTANATAQDRAECLAAGMNDHIAKPIEPERLPAALALWLPDAPAAPAPPAAPPERARLPQGIEGLEVETGLRRVGGAAATYLRLLRMFVRQEAEAAAEIRAALAAADRTTAQRRAHTLRGLAGSLGARSLEAAAARLERAIREGAEEPAFAPALEAFTHLLGALVPALAAFLDQPTGAPAGTGAVDPQHLAALCDDLRRLLADSDVAAVRLFEAHAEELRAAFPDCFAALAAAIGAFEFTAAAALLARAVAQDPPPPETAPGAGDRPCPLP